jgi:hypothetical protein
MSCSHIVQTPQDGALPCALALGHAGPCEAKLPHRWILSTPDTEIRRLRALISEAEHVYMTQSISCPWCDWDKPKHAPACPAFSSPGVVREGPYNSPSVYSTSAPVSAKRCDAVIRCTETLDPLGRPAHQCMLNEGHDGGHKAGGTGLAPSKGHRAWQCSGCRWVFDGPHQERCPECSRVGYWTGSVDPAGLRWPGYVDGRASARLMENWSGK